uniref:NADH-ubiquinone oxidoreductase chain 2 n=1 Tax=Calliotropis micraulax TaxID=2496602 RepID=A0A6B7FMT0_9VEST|nr:NADH dehydrogenase subunit 2 [Calliotropis micraulax]
MPFGFLFILTLLFGTILSLSSAHWLPIWVGLEVNLMGFIPILVYSGTSMEAESAVKYFIMQALGSGMLMFGSLLAFSKTFSWEMQEIATPELGMFIISMSLILKMGGFPFHFWVPSVMSGISWFSCLILTTWQKLAPVFLLSTMLQSWPATSSNATSIFLVLAGASSLVGGVGGINQTQVRALLAYSSIGHVGWMVFCTTTSESALKIYFPIYFLVSLCLFSSMWSAEMTSFNQTSPLSLTNPKTHRLILIFMLLSLGGMPPLLGFVGKWSVINLSATMNTPLLMAPLIIGSLLSLFYYLSLLFSINFSAGSLAVPTTLSKNMISGTKFSTPSTPHNLMTSVILIFNLGGSILLSSSLSVLDFL